ncbi:hypothetical protein AX768_03615 [Burkholderia sp. PAMC 28687]|uniref:YfbU family protein n=1 Tax=Burkholderia sp. PAMC 28687 TaxID=1795874 RepID=UPI000784C5B4|nr:YfbU family protein [Burkholderia sp. PAMC 28687]AMM13332.1 hypothetical protein AX768_03615 [Burkholderia sp. PAMC 28687]
MKMSNAEKLIATMLCEVMKKVKATDELDPDLIQDAIYSNHLWAIEWKYHGLFADNADETPEEVGYVVDVLDMWSFIEDASAGLSTEDVARVKEAHPHFSGTFPGFDGNNESELLSIARMLVGKLERFEEFDGRVNNSHMPTTPRYKRMLTVFEPIRVDLGAPRKLNADELIAIFARQ